MTGCPPWCVEPHDDGEDRHLAEMLDVVLTAHRTPVHTPRLFLTLRQAPGEDQQLIQLDFEEQQVALLPPAEAAELGAKLIELARLVGES